MVCLCLVSVFVVWWNVRCCRLMVKFCGLWCLLVLLWLDWGSGICCCCVDRWMWCCMLLSVLVVIRWWLVLRWLFN